jgi:hypothetical protein
MTHFEFIAGTTARMRDVGPVAVLDEIRASAGADHHDTLTVFFVWAIDRLLCAGLSDTAVVWHPLTDVRSPWSWYDEATLASAEARAHFVPATRSLLGEPTPAEPQVLVAA